MLCSIIFPLCPFLFFLFAKSSIIFTLSCLFKGRLSYPHPGTDNLLMLNGKLDETILFFQSIYVNKDGRMPFSELFLFYVLVILQVQKWSSHTFCAESRIGVSVYPGWQSHYRSMCMVAWLSSGTTVCGDSPEFACWLSGQWK